MTEQDVIDFYRPYLSNLARKFSPRIPSADAICDAEIELLLAIRGYRPAFHGPFWKTYAYPKITSRLIELQKQQNTLRHWESFSLNDNVTDESHTTFLQFLLVESPKVTRIELRELLSYAPKKAREVGWMIIDNYSPSEIQESLHISRSEYHHCLCALKDAWENYNQDIC